MAKTKAKRKRDSMIFIATSLALVVGVALWQVNTSPVLGATPSDGCYVCHLDADVMEAMYEVPPPADGPG